MAEELKPDNGVPEMRRLIGKVAERHGIRIDFSDPAFYVLSLNEFALEESTRTIAESIRQAARDFENAAENVQGRAGTFLAQQIRESINAARLQFDREVSEVTVKTSEKLSRLHQIHAKFAFHCAVAGLISGALLLVVGILIGLSLR